MVRCAGRAATTALRHAEPGLPPRDGPHNRSENESSRRSWRPPGAHKAIKNMIAQRRQIAAGGPVERLKYLQKRGMPRNTGFGRAWRHEDADAQFLRQFEPGPHCAHDGGCAVVGDSETLASQTRRRGAGLETPKRLAGAATQTFDQYFAWAAGAEQHEDRGPAGPDQPRQATRHRLEIFDAIQAREIGKRAVQRHATFAPMPGGERSKIFRRHRFRTASPGAE